jgi:acylphosphatase
MQHPSDCRHPQFEKADGNQQSTVGGDGCKRLPPFSVLDSIMGFTLSSRTQKETETMAVHAKHIIVHGRVQGVGFRYFVQHVGNRMGLAGDVRNCPDSTVEIVVEGAAGKMADFIKQVEKGPPLARVERVDVADIPIRGTYGSFSIEGW